MNNISLFISDLKHFEHLTVFRGLVLILLVLRLFATEAAIKEGTKSLVRNDSIFAGNHLVMVHRTQKVNQGIQGKLLILHPITLELACTNVERKHISIDNSSKIK